MSVFRGKMLHAAEHDQQSKHVVAMLQSDPDYEPDDHMLGGGTVVDGICIAAVSHPDHPHVKYVANHGIKGTVSCASAHAFTFMSFFCCSCCWYLWEGWILK